MLAGLEVEPRPNRNMVAQIMAGEWYSVDETIWSGVMRAPAAHWQAFARAGSTKGGYWLPPTEVSIRYKRDDDFIAHYRELFSQCVRRASRSHLAIGCEVSGGLDSSAVLAMAASIDTLPLI